MTPTFWLVFILIVIIGEWLLELLLSLLNLRSLTPDLPAEFAGIYDADKYSKSQRYTTDTTRFGIISATFSTIIIVCFLLAGGFNVIDTVARSAGFGEIVSGLIFTAILMLLSGIISLPFSIYSTFVIEERYGFNTTTVKTFIIDLIKQVILGAVIGGVILTAILLFLEKTGSSAWLYCWALVCVVTLLMLIVVPTFIMPLFNKFSPLPDGELKEEILAYAEKENFAIKGLFVMDGSKRSRKGNAFFTGFGKWKKIVFFDTLLEQLNTDEIIAVLAHEMGHYKHHHQLKMLAATVIQTGILFYFFSLIQKNPQLFAAFGMGHISNYASLIFFGFLFTPVNLVLSLLSLAASRRHEYQADAYSAASTGNPEALVSGLQQLTVQNLGNLTPHPATVFFHHGHPPVVERIRALRKGNTTDN